MIPEQVFERQASVDVREVFEKNINWEKKRFVSMRKWGQHYFRNYKGFGASQSILINLQGRGIIWYRLVVKCRRGDVMEDGSVREFDGERVFDILVEDFLQAPTYYDSTIVRAGERQHIASISDMKEVGV